ncbi:MAG: hypothetical protein Ta2B_13920 [Termitinemataceae bacterium]|nr:MAG: hypothetical protein Ta2B_13920 [Termitinemataceae bacterium]
MVQEINNTPQNNGATPAFETQMRGYDREQVDAVIARFQQEIVNLRTDLDRVKSSASASDAKVMQLSTELSEAQSLRMKVS